MLKAVPAWTAAPLAACLDRLRKLSIPALGFVTIGAAAELAIGWRFATSAVLPAYLVFGGLGAVVSLFDLAEQRVPNRLVLPSYPLLIGLFAVGSAYGGRWHEMIQATLAMLVLLGVFALIAFVRPGELGLGDVKLAGLTGLACGYLGAAVVVASVLIAFTSAAAALLALRVSGRGNKARLPFAPFMIFGSILAVLLVR